jgi:hypothetical protein
MCSNENYSKLYIGKYLPDEDNEEEVGLEVKGMILSREKS